MPFAHCPTCAGPAVLDPTGRCPEGHLVGATGAGGPAALGSTSSPEEATDLDELASLTAAVRSLDDRGTRGGAPGPAAHVPELPHVPTSVGDAVEAPAHRDPRDALAQALAEVAADLQPAAVAVDMRPVTVHSGAPAPSSAALERHGRHAPPARAAGDDGEPARPGGRPTDPTEPIAPVRRPDVASTPSIEDELAAYDGQAADHTHRPVPAAPRELDGFDGFDGFDLDDLDPTVEVARRDAGASPADEVPTSRAYPTPEGPRPEPPMASAGPEAPTPGPEAGPVLDGMNFTAKGGRVGRSDRGAKNGRRGPFRR